MDSKEFVEAIKNYVGEVAVKGTIADLKKPSGRRVPPEVKAHSDWYNQLSETDVNYVNSTVATAVHAALFGLFAVLDGARAIEDGPERGRFELSYVRDQRVLLNDPSKIGLHDLFNATD